ncbi:hypothetical protein BDP81DRAFT_421387 [Colletotrichum phormii]|uniref:Uncharacterized protein n=1 Tax=Colletotrichum phormii TaxID=359342 RepID=A0AAI9ZWR7_9PEZI|nr:uncharacterized protein BDP81DRAFT_421387 [Colletotrichum phormii]KAK1639598.1 hypothetical protein BDP81DRAFT_421387 [Colletotrichum phormii]
MHEHGPVRECPKSLSITRRYGSQRKRSVRMVAFMVIRTEETSRTSIPCSPRGTFVKLHSIVITELCRITRGGISALLSFPSDRYVRVPHRIARARYVGKEGTSEHDKVADRSLLKMTFILRCQKQDDTDSSAKLMKAYVEERMRMGYAELNPPDRKLHL